MPSGYTKSRPWTAAEDAELERLDRLGTSTADIAVTLWRTEHAVRFRLRKHVEMKDVVDSDDLWEQRENTKGALIRVTVYEAAIKRTRDEVVAELADRLTADAVDKALQELIRPWRGMKASLWIDPDTGKYVQVVDRDMFHGGSDEPRVGKIRRAGGRSPRGRMVREYAA